MSMVEFDPVPEEDYLLEKLQHQGGDIAFMGLVEVMEDLSSRDAERLVQLIANHARYTGSARAKAILADWKTWRTKFVKVMPVEYRRALRELEKSRTLQAAE
jgi:glutamate synthase (NADPH/NADH) large chain